MTPCLIAYKHHNMYKKFAKLIGQLTLLYSILGIYSCAPDQASCEFHPTPKLMTNKMKGMSLVAAKSPIQGTPVQKLKNIGVDWIATLPYGYYKSGDPYIDSISCCPLPNCPHGPSTKYAVKEVIQKAHDQGLKVMVKPQLWSATEWVGELSFDTEDNWDIFEKNYTMFIMDWVHIAADMEVEMFCIGTELAKFVQHRPNYWNNLIADIRQVYTGQLTYASNWDKYQAVPFWSALDCIGVDAYFPLIPDKTPSVCHIIEAWKPYKEELYNYTVEQQKPILFAEFGYLSLDACAYKTWELEANMKTTSMNEEAQANALQALFEVFGTEEWWLGGFQWKWYADALSASCEQDLSKDYTPEGKMAEELLKEVYE